MNELPENRLPFGYTTPPSASAIERSPWEGLVPNHVEPSRTISNHVDRTNVDERGRDVIVPSALAPRFARSNGTRRCGSGDRCSARADRRRASRGRSIAASVFRGPCHAVSTGLRARRHTAQRWCSWIRYWEAGLLVHFQDEIQLSLFSCLVGKCLGSSRFVCRSKCFKPLSSPRYSTLMLWNSNVCFAFREYGGSNPFRDRS